MLEALAGLAGFVLLLVGVIAIVRRLTPKTPRDEVVEQLSGLRASPMVDWEDGDVRKLVGTVRLVEPAVTAPISGRACAVFELQVEEWHYQRRMEGHGTVEMRPVIRERRAAPFLLDDGTGTARVDVSAGATVVVKPDLTYERDAQPDDATAKRMVSVVERHGKRTGSYRYVEGALVDGTRVAVRGRGRWERPEGMARQLMLRADGETKLYIGNEDGVFD